MGSKGQSLAISRIALWARPGAIMGRIMCLPFRASSGPAITGLGFTCTASAVQPECAGARIGGLQLLPETIGPMGLVFDMSDLADDLI